jgi:four helix bundle protein
MHVERFEDLEIWQEARALCKLIYEVTSKEPFHSDFKFREQVRAAGGSIMDNIAEGFGRGGNKEFVSFLSISNGSCNEVRSQSYRAFDFNYIDKVILDELLERTTKESKQITSFINYLKKSERRGPKYE